MRKASCAELGPLLSPFCLSFQLPHLPSRTMCLVSVFFFCFLFIFAFPSLSIESFSEWVLLLVFLACFQMGSYFVTTGWIFEMGLLCENSI